MSALDTQVGGSHYKNLKIQPVEYITANGISYMEGNVIKYVTRWRDKGGLRDLEKAKHYLEMLIEMQNQKAKDGMLELVEKELEDCKSDTGDKQDNKGFSITYTTLIQETCGQGLEPELAKCFIRDYGEITITDIPNIVPLDRWAKVAKTLNLGIWSSKVYTPKQGGKGVYDVRYWSIADKTESSDCEDQPPKKKYANVHYEHIKHYITNGEITPGFIDDYIKANDNRILVVLGVPMGVSHSIWTKLAAKHDLELQMIKQPARLDGITKSYTVELWIDTDKVEPCKSEETKPTVSAASVHYENIKSYIANGRVAPALVDDYIKPVGRFVVRSVPIEVSIGIWTAFALAQALEVEFIKQPMGLDGISRAYDVELWLKK